MKLTFFAILSMAFLVGCSHFQSSQRVPASSKDDRILDPSAKFPCGLKGSVKDRIADCSNQLSSQKERFVLVTRTKEFKEVYKEMSTGLLWSDRLPEVTNLFYAKNACKAQPAEVANISEVRWRLPSRGEYDIAQKNGISISLPNMDTSFWSATQVALPEKFTYEYGYAWIYDGKLSHTQTSIRASLSASIRCVGMEY